MPKAKRQLFNFFWPQTLYRRQKLSTTFEVQDRHQRRFSSLA
jgi:hypothetical protein